MKPRFTLGLCNYLEGYGWPIRIEIIFDGEVKPPKPEIHIIIEDLPLKDQDEFIKEMQKEAKTVCTNG